MNAIIVFYGPPGSGKTTISKKINDSLKCPLISVNELVNRIIQNKLTGYYAVQKAIMKGSLIPDLYLIPIIEHDIKDVVDGMVILDGYPRTTSQIDHLLQLKKGIIVSFYFDLDMQVILNRLNSRLYCQSCGRTYDASTSAITKCPYCQKKIEKRIDDYSDIIHSRIIQYYTAMDQIIEMLEEHTIFHKIDADMQVDELSNLCLSLIRKDLDVNKHIFNK